MVNVGEKFVRWRASFVKSSKLCPQAWTHFTKPRKIRTNYVQAFGKFRANPARPLARLAKPDSPSSPTLTLKPIAADLETRAGGQRPGPSAKTSR